VKSKPNVGHFCPQIFQIDELKRFYSSLFEWQFEKGQTQDYWMIKNAGTSEGVAPKENPEQMPTMFISVESIDDYNHICAKLLCFIGKGNQQIDAGYHAVLEDPEDNTFGIWQDK
jgi:predicted enzyme related to lactoylglutathione lyase